VASGQDALGGPVQPVAELAAGVGTGAELAEALRTLRRRHARQSGEAELTYREIAAKTGWSLGIVGGYFAGQVLPPTDRFDVLAQLLGATPAEQGALATARDRVDERRRRPVPAARAGSAPAHLPADVAAFTGRAADLAELDRLTGAAEPAAVVISAVSGTAGVGKTALAVRWAHRVADRFPDGQLYVNLRGYDADQPMPPADALAALLRALGVPAADVPLDRAERTARYRAEIAGRRVLVLLDNAGSVEQVRPLLPGTGPGLVLVTSRDSLAGLVARDGAHRIDLDLLPPADARALLRRLVGPRVDAEPAAAAALAAQCGRLPLALRVAAELATSRPGSTLTELVDELADQRQRLDLLDAGGDPHTAVRSVFSWSYQRLPATDRRAFRLLGLHPGADVDGYAVAALTGTSLAAARRALGRLSRAHLVQAGAAGRFGMHDLLRVYAAELARRDEAEADRRAALARLYGYYVATAAAAMDALHPAERHRRPPVPDPGTPAPELADLAAAQAWLDAERANLVGTAAHGSPEQVVVLASTLFRYLDSGGHYPDALTVHGHALRAAQRLGDGAAESRARCDLAVVYSRQVQLDRCIDYLRQALALARQVGDRQAEARALGVLGVAHHLQGRSDLAVEHDRQVLAVFRELGDRTNEARALGNLGVAYRAQGRPELAVVHQRQALAAFRALGERVGEAEVGNALAESLRAVGDTQQAAREHAAALAVALEIGNRHEQACAHHNLGAIYQATGDQERARRHWQLAYELYVELALPGADDVLACLTDHDLLGPAADDGPGAASPAGGYGR